MARAIPLSQFIKESQRLAAKGIEDWTKPMKQSATAVKEDSKLNFQRGEDPEGRPWKPLSNIAIQSRRKKSSEPLRDTARLMNSVVSNRDGHIEQVDNDSVKVGTNLLYANLQQNGGIVRPKGRALAIPLTPKARKFNPRKAPAFPDPPGLFKLPGVPILFQRGRGKQLKPMYLLKSSVTVPARPFIGAGERLMKTLGLIFGKFIDDWLEKGLK